MKRFTLIELLVVIAIIGILASLLLPVLSKARGVSRQAVCTSNLKQISMIAYLYSDDNSSYFPAKRRDVAGAEAQQINWLGKTGSLAYAKRADTMASQRFLNPYIKANVTDSDDIDIARCPTDLGERQYGRAGSSYGGNNMRPNQGVTTSLGIDKNSVTNGVIQVNSVKNASRMVYFFEMPVTTVLVGGNAGPNAVFHYKPYDFRFQLAFVDGHVASGVPVNAGLYSTTSYTFDDDL